MLRSCKYCGGIHDPHTICPKKPIYNYGAKTNRHRSKAGDIRKRNIWKLKSIEIRQRDKYLCRYCLTQGKLTAHDLSVHHIVPINEDDALSFENSNLITLCNKCHDLAEHGLIDRELLKDLAITEAQLYPPG